MSDSESLPSDIEEIASQAISTLLPEKSKVRYESAFNKYEYWCIEKGVRDFTNQKVLLAYFYQLSKNFKPTSLWSFYSMIRTVICVKKSVDISKYASLVAFLRKNAHGFKPRKSKVLTKSDISKFLLEAEDYHFLFMKVALIVGLAGACRKQELTNLTIDDVRDKGECFQFHLPSRNTESLRQFVVHSGDIDDVNMVDIIRTYISLRPTNVSHNRFFVRYRDMKCQNQPVGINTFASLAKSIASYLNLESPENYSGICMRRSSKSLLPISSVSTTTPSPMMAVNPTQDTENSI